MKYWGVDLGGTKIECAVINIENGLDIITRKRISTEANKGYSHIISRIKQLVDEVSEELCEAPANIGFATPGVLEPESGLMKNSNTVCLNGKPMLQDLEAALNMKVRLANDANCFALAETLMGAGRQYPNAEVVFGVILGTGVGGGLVVNKKIITGMHGIAGEWGHNILEESGEPCYCGKAGCVEKVISGPALESFYKSFGGRDMKLNEIVEHHLSGNDKLASATIARLLEFYGKGIATLINVLDPDLIVIGGGVGNIDLLYSAGYQLVKKYAFNKGKLSTPICKPLLGDSAGVIGAALLYKK